MKIDRLIGILSVLLRQERVTAPYLAEKFEVSRRTINRDIDALCRGGIPIVTASGKNGGIYIADGYKIDRTLLTKNEMQAVLAGLRSLDSVSGSGVYSRLMEKLSFSSSSVVEGGENILIDLSSWYKDTLAPKIELIKKSMELGRMIEFSYYSPNGESIRAIEPYYLIFKWTGWYVWGFCLMREDYRLFKLNRMDKLKTGESFKKREHGLPDLSNERIFHGELKAKVLFEPHCKWRLIEDFGIDSFEELESGKLLFTMGFNDTENLLSWLMTFGDSAVLLEPENAVSELKKRLKNAAELYEKGEKNEISVD